MSGPISSGALEGEFLFVTAQSGWPSGKGATRADLLFGKREIKAFMLSSRCRATTLRPLDLYPMAPGLRGTRNFALEGMSVANTTLIDTPNGTAMRDALTKCSPRQGAASALDSRRCEEHQSGHISNIGDGPRCHGRGRVAVPLERPLGGCSKPRRQDQRLSLTSPEEMIRPGREEPPRHRLLANRFCLYRSGALEHGS
jgi:hypothetical protein